MDRKSNVLNQNKRDIDFNKSLESGFMEEDIMNNDQKKTIADQKMKLDKIEDMTNFIAMAEIKLKLTTHLEKSADICLEKCDKNNNLYNRKSFISVDAYPCLFNCISKRHLIMKKSYDILSKSKLVIEKEDIDYENLYDEPEYYRDS